MTIPPYTGRKFFSASLSNAYSQALLEYFSYAISPVQPFQTREMAYNADNDGTHVTIWSGYMLYTGDTDIFRYSFNHEASHGSETANTDIKIDGNSIPGFPLSNQPGATRTGTVDISSMGLIAGTVYSVTLESWRSGTAATVNLTVDVYWLGLSKTINYTTPPTFSTSQTDIDDEMETIRTGINEIEQAVVMPAAPNGWERYGNPGHGNGVGNSGSPVIVWRGYFYHTHDRLRYRYRHGTSEAAVKTEIFIDNSSVGSWTVRTHDYTRSGTLDISGLGLVQGNIYEARIEVSRSGTSKMTSIFCWAYQLSQESNVIVTAPPVWVHGGTNVTAANLNRYRDIINTIHPGAPSPTAPLYYEQPAVKTTNSNKYYIQHRRRWLRYRPDTMGTPEIRYGPNLHSTAMLDTTTGNQSYDLNQIPRLVFGQYYWIDDVDYAQEYSSQQP